MEQWDNYFIANAGAAAALTGLIFVAVSINLQRILSIKHLPDRALNSTVLLANILFICCLCLVPAQPRIYLGCELLFTTAITSIICIQADIKTLFAAPKEYKLHAIRDVIFTFFAIGPLVSAAVCLFGNCAPVAFYYLVPGVVFSFIKALLDAWVLLIEINR